MSGNLPIVLIVVMWIFVLAPLLLRGQKPIRRTNKALEETRVVYEGGTGEIKVPRRRPRFTRSDIHVGEPQDEDYDLVDAYELTDDDAGAFDTAADVQEPESEAGAVAEQQTGDDTVVDGEVITASTGSVAYRVDASMLAADGTINPDVEPANEATANDSAADESLADASEAVDQTDDATDVYATDSSFIEPADLMYPGEPETDELAVSEHDETAETEVEPEELSAEEIAFAERRKGRGGFDPKADAEVTLDRYERRKRTLLALVVALVVAIPIAFLVGRWMWALPVLVVATIAMYLWALRQQVKAENRVRARRIRNLRRSRLGVRLNEDEKQAIPPRLRTPAGVVLEVDDASPDFDGSLAEVQFVSSEMQQAG